MDVTDEYNGCFVVRMVCRTWLIVCLTTLVTTASLSLVFGFLDNKVIESLYSSNLSSARFQQPHQSPALAIRLDDRGVDYYRLQADGRLAIRSRALEDRIVALLQQHAARGSEPMTGSEVESTVAALIDLFAMQRKQDDVIVRTNERDDDLRFDAAEVEDAEIWLSKVLKRWLLLENNRRLKPVVDNLTAIIQATVPSRQRCSPVSMNIHEKENE